MPTNRPLRICVDARIPDGPYDGIGAVVRGLASALCELDDDTEEYAFLVYGDSHCWMLPYQKGPCKILTGPNVPIAGRLRVLARRVPGVRRAWNLIGAPRRIETSDGTVENAGFDVIHFTTQSAFLTAVPSIYQPHDLQHLHLPQYFSRRVRLRREVEYRTYCEQAALVVAMSSWGREDLIRRYKLQPERVAVVPWAAGGNSEVAPGSERIAQVRQRYKLPDAFAFFPSRTWPHKNHLGLIQAIALLRRKFGVRVYVICSGHRDDFFNKIEGQVQKSQLNDQVRFVGFVPEDDLQCLYHASRCVVFPTKFEGWGLPLLEAFRAGTPVACSRINPLCEQAADAALLFNPDNQEEMAATILRLWTDGALRDRLAAAGRERAALFSWRQTARLFRAHYRKLGKRTLAPEDRALLSSSPIV